MRQSLKKIFKRLPIFVKRTTIVCIEAYHRMDAYLKEKREYSFIPNARIAKSRQRVLVYHIVGLKFGGTEKNLQIIANSLADDYDVYYMYSHMDKGSSRKEFMDPRITLIPFTYSATEAKHPYYISGMNPHIKNIVAEHGIDLIIISEAGHSIYPTLTITDTPIIMVNNFGSPAMQKNIVHVNYVSEKVREYAQSYTGSSKKFSVLNTPTTKPLPRESLPDLRQQLGINPSDFVFGRIGRNSDAIFDPIGIQAFQLVVSMHPEAKYLIMAPPPKLVEIVEREKIPNVYFLQPTHNEADVWAFHYALDALAHFRYDGESLGLNIAESMMVGNPIISHKSRIWNAHVDYLEPTFARIAEIDDVETYARYMEEFISIRQNEPERWERMREISKTTAYRLFTVDDYMSKFKSIIKSHLS